jgi:hypothetical protein
MEPKANIYLFLAQIRRFCKKTWVRSGLQWVPKTPTRLNRTNLDVWLSMASELNAEPHYKGHRLPACLPNQTGPRSAEGSTSAVAQFF